MSIASRPRSKTKRTIKKADRREKSVLGFLAAVSLFVISTPSAYAAHGPRPIPNCDFTQELQSLSENLPGPDSPRAEWARHSQLRYQAAQRAADSVFAAYRSGKWTEGSLVACPLPPSESRALELALPVRFFEQTLLGLEGSNSPAVRAFTHEVRRRSEGENILAYRLVGHLPGETNPTDRAGGYHRGHQSIFMDFERIEPTQWTTIFVHELLHALDTDLLEGMRTFGDPDLRSQVERIAKASTSYDDLSSADRAILEEWILAGLDRGYLAEARAWAATLSLYEKLKDEDLQNPIVWLEAIRKQRLGLAGNSETNFQLFLRYLDQRFTDPREGIFSTPLLQAAVAETRARLRSGEIPVRLGILSAYE